MKCIDKIYSIIILAVLSMTFGGCGKLAYEVPYSVDSGYLSSRYGIQEGGAKAEPFAAKVCVQTEDILTDSIDDSSFGTAGLFDLKNREVIYAKSLHEKMYPASLTKVMTAIIALENGSLDMVLTTTEAVKITEAGAAKAGLKQGDTMTLDQAMHILLLASSNDVALLIADNIGAKLEGVSGDTNVEKFLNMMNKRAAQLGATNTHFSNPHGLTDPEHYTTAYDMYLIFNKAIQYETFNQIINMTAYQTTYYDKNGKEIPYSCGTTNKYLKEQASAPENVTILGGKTGTTNAAGHCLILHAKDIRGNSYISIVMRCLNNDMLYAEMSDLLAEINK